MPHRSMLSHSSGRWQVPLPRASTVTIIIAIIVQTAGVSWWASALTLRVDNFEKQSASFGRQTERVIRLEERIAIIQQGVSENRNLLMKLSNELAERAGKKE